MNMYMKSSNSMRVTALELPEYLVNPTAVGRFLQDIPYVGNTHRAYRQLWRQLRNRTPDCISLWNNIVIDTSLRDSISEIIVEYMRWPNDLFIPGDSCRAMFLKPGGDMSDVEAMLRIEDVHHIKSIPYEDVWSWNYETFLLYVQGYCKR